MRNRTAIFSSAIVLSVVGVVAFAAPASAATPVTVAVAAAGGLEITAPTATVVVPGLTASAAAQNFTVGLGSVTVNDGLGGTAGWVASVTASDFVDGALSIPLTGAATYSSVQTAVTGTVAVDYTDSTTLAAVTEIATATASGVNSATWTPSLTVTVPAGTLAGNYGSSVVHSVL
jgi:hypothetical protein